NERVALDDQHWLNRSARSHGKPPTRPSSHPGIQVQRVSRLRVAAVLPVRSDRLALLAALDGIGELRSEIQRWHQSPYLDSESRSSVSSSMCCCMASIATCGQSGSWPTSSPHQTQTSSIVLS